MRLGTVYINDLSTYRTQLMGIATLMIIACHAPASGVVLPTIVSHICDLGNYGVDLFLLLSGLGVYYSLSKQPVTSILGGAFYLKKRFTRIFIPYLIIYIPYCIVMMLLGKYTIGDSLLCLTTLEYWIYHKGAWFVSLILALYVLSPLLYRLVESKGKWLYVSLMIIGIMAVCNWSGIETSGRGFVSNIAFAFGRVPCFLIGMVIGKDCQNENKLSASWLILPVFLYLLCIKYLSIYNGIAWMIIPLLVFLLSLFIKVVKIIPWCINALSLLGRISLESYLANITVNSLLLCIIPVYLSAPMFRGRWLEYVFVLVFGLTLAYFVNRVSNKLYNSVNYAK